MVYEDVKIIDLAQYITHVNDQWWAQLGVTVCIRRSKQGAAFLERLS
jgi:hypothetical protein